MDILGGELDAEAISETARDGDGGLRSKASDVGLGVASYGDVGWTQAFAAEFVGTFILVFTVFGVIHHKAPAGFAGLAIGLVVFAAIIPVAPTTGASINPARTFGLDLIGRRPVGPVHHASFTAARR